MIPIPIVDNNKDHGLLGIDLMKEDTAKFINSIKADENNIGLRCYWVSIRLKENHPPSYVEFRKLPIHILPIAVAK